MSKILTLKAVILSIFLAKSYTAFAADLNCEPANNIVRTVAAQGEELLAFAGPRLEDPRKAMSELDSDSEIKAFWPGANSADMNSVQIIKCGKSTGSAFIACDNKTVITNAHLVSDLEPGEVCHFGIRGARATVNYIEVEMSGKDKPLFGKSTSSAPDIGQDWAVLTLKQPAEGLTPTNVMSTNSEEDILGQKIIHAAGYHKDFGDQKPGPRAYSICGIYDTGKKYHRGYSVSNCKTGPGSSGSPGFAVSDNHPYVLAINSSRFLPGAEEKVKTDGAYFVPVKGEFLEAIKKRTSNKNCIKPFKRETQQASL